MIYAMHVVSNTSPILNLAIIGRLELLRAQFGKILIPPAVFGELHTGDDLPGSQDTREAIRSGWIEIREIRDTLLVRLLQNELDKGEAEAIALALHIKTDWTLLDEREARKMAKSLGLKVTGVLGILARAQREGRISSLKEAMEELREKARFRIGNELFTEILISVGENSSGSPSRPKGLSKPGS